MTYYFLEEYSIKTEKINFHISIFLIVLNKIYVLVTGFTNANEDSFVKIKTKMQINIQR